MLMLYAVALTFVIAMLGTTLPTPLYPGYQQAFGISEVMVTVIYAVYALGVIGSAILTGRLSDQFGRRPLLALGLVFSALSAVCFLVADSVGTLLLGRVLSGISAGIFTSTATVTIIELAQPELKSRATLLATAANMGGLGLGPLIAGTFAQFLPWPLWLVYAFNLGLIALAAGLVALAPETADRPKRPRVTIQLPRLPAEVRPVFVPAAIAGFAGFAVMGLFAAIAPAFLGEVLHIAHPVVVGAVVFVLFLSSTSGQIAQDRLPETWRLPFGCVLLIIGILFVALGIGLASITWLVAGAIVCGLGQGISFRAGMGLVTQASPVDRRGEVAASFFIVVYIAISLPVIGLGLLASSYGLVKAGLVFCALVAMLSFISLGWLLRDGLRARRS